MKKTLVTVALTALAAVAFGANPPAIQWQRIVGPRDRSGAVCVQQTADGGFIIAGDTWVDRSTQNMHLVRTDAQGNTLWRRTYGGPHVDYGNAVRQTPDGGFILCGEKNSRLRDSAAAAVMKLDSLGNIIWTALGPARASALDVELTADGGYITVGGFTYTDSIYLRKLDAQGSLQWHVLLPGLIPFWWKGATLYVQQTSDGGYVTASDKVYKTDSLGSLLWTRQYPSEEVLFSVRQTTDGGYIATGIAPDPQKPEHKYNLVLLKLDAQGNQTWKKLYRDSGPTDGRTVRQTSSGGYFVTGNSAGIYLLKTNAQGNKLWDLRIPGIARADWGEPTADGGYVVVSIDNVLVKLAPEGQ